MVHREHRSSGRPGPVVLGRLARSLAELVADGAPHLVVRVGATAHGVTELTVAAAPCGGVDGLVGWRADDGAHAVAVAAAGRTTGGTVATGGELAVAHVVDRCGRSASAVAPLGGTARHAGTDAVGGRLDDVCRRALGLPTPAEPGPTTAYWVGRLLVALARSSPVRDWSDVAAVATTAFAVVVPPDDPTRLRAVLDRLGAAHDWAHIRAAVATGAQRAEGVDAAAAAWMDEGTFARWSVAALRRTAPPADVLAGLGGDAGRVLAGVLRACGTVPRR